MPKSQAPFLAYQRYPITYPVTLGARVEHAVREHQWEGRFLTRGVSCTKDWKIALKYAKEHQVVVRIDEAVCDRLGIERFCVKDCLPLKLIKHPEDEEVILVFRNDGAFPRELVTAVFTVTGFDDAEPPQGPVLGIGGMEN